MNEFLDIIIEYYTENRSIIVSKTSVDTNFYLLFLVILLNVLMVIVTLSNSILMYLELLYIVLLFLMLMIITVICIVLLVIIGMYKDYQSKVYDEIIVNLQYIKLHQNKIQFTDKNIIDMKNIRMSPEKYLATLRKIVLSSPHSH